MRFCLVGAGIASSPSPALHQAMLRASGVDGVYELRDISAHELPGVVAQLRSGHYAGCNVTIPYKAEVTAHCDVLEGDASLLHMVNTVAADEGRLAGGNTDSAGFERALETQGLVPPPGCHALVMGAGGAAAAVCLALVRMRAGRITLAARRPDAASGLVERLRSRAEVRVAQWERAALQPQLSSLHIAVNATPEGLASLPLHPRDLPASCTVADVRYAPVPVDVVTAARDTGHRACDGREMLLQQALLSFARWTGLEPSAPVARRALDRALA